MIPGIVAAAASSASSIPVVVVNPTYSGFRREEQIITLASVGSGWQGGDVSGGYVVRFYLDGNLAQVADYGPFNDTFDTTSLHLAAHHVGKVLTAQIFSYNGSGDETAGPIKSFGGAVLPLTGRVGWTQHNDIWPVTFSGDMGHVAEAGGDIHGRWIRATKGRKEGWYYWEIETSDLSPLPLYMGFGAYGSTNSLSNYLGRSGTMYQVGMQNTTGDIFAGNTTAEKTGDVSGVGDRVGILVKITPLGTGETVQTAKAWFTVDGTTWNDGTGSPALETGGVTFQHTGSVYPMVRFDLDTADETITGYFNRSEFLHTMPAYAEAWDALPAFEWSTTGKSADIALSNHNLTATRSSFGTGAPDANVQASVYSNNSDDYLRAFQITIDNISNFSSRIGVTLGFSGFCSLRKDGVVHSNTTAIATLPAMATGDVWLVVFNAASKTIWFKKQGNAFWNASGSGANPATGTGGLNAIAGNPGYDPVVAGNWYPFARLVGDGSELGQAVTITGNAEDFFETFDPTIIRGWNG